MWIDDIWVDGANQEESKKEVLESQKASCTSFGFTPDSDAHAECVMQLFIAEQAEANSAIERWTRLSWLQQFLLPEAGWLGAASLRVFLKRSIKKSLIADPGEG